MDHRRNRVVTPAEGEKTWLRILETLNEYQARLFVAEKALQLGRGGISRLSQLTGMSRVTITQGLSELRVGKKLRTAAERVRQPGGGRKKVEQADPELPRHLKEIVEETTAGDPMSPLRWTSKSTRTIAAELSRSGHPISSVTVGRCLEEMGYTLQANVKTREGPQHPNRDAQFRYLNRQVKDFRRAGDPVISVDTKKKELVGALKTRAADGCHRETPTAYRCTTFRTWAGAKPFPTALTTSLEIEPWSTSALLMTRRSSPPRASDGGGVWTESGTTGARPGCSSAPTAEAAMAPGRGHGNYICKR